MILNVAALVTVTGLVLGLPRCFRSLEELCPEAFAGWACRRILAVAALVTGRALGLLRCFRSLGELCPEASAGCACRRTAAVVGALDFARCYHSL